MALFGAKIKKSMMYFTDKEPMTGPNGHRGTCEWLRPGKIFQFTLQGHNGRFVEREPGFNGRGRACAAIHLLSGSNPSILSTMNFGRCFTSS